MPSKTVVNSACKEIGRDGVERFVAQVHVHYQGIGWLREGDYVDSTREGAKTKAENRAREIEAGG